MCLLNLDHLPISIHHNSVLYFQVQYHYHLDLGIDQAKNKLMVDQGFIFKVLVALIDTPLLYLGVYLFRKKFDLEINEEIDI